jgi:hypothetical protein
MTTKDKELLREHIDRIVENYISEDMLNEKGKKKKSKKKKDKKSDSKEDSKTKKEKRINSKNTKAASRRARVILWLKDPSINCAEIMRKLWKPSKKKEDAARSFFYKCRDGALNDSGVAYSFSDKEINRLYAIKNNIL